MPPIESDEADYIVSVRHANLLKERQALEQQIRQNERRSQRLTVKALERWCSK